MVGLENIFAFKKLLSKIKCNSFDFREKNFYINSSDKINYLQNTQECISGKDILVVLTEWNEFRALSPLEISKLMKGNIVIDLRNIFDSKSIGQTKFS